MTCDCVAPRAFSSEMRTARKIHYCVECGADVAPGQRYCYIWGIWDDAQSTYKICAGCDHLRAFLEARVVPHCICYGGLRYEFPEEYSVYSIACAPCETNEDAEALGKALGHLYRLGMDQGWGLGPVSRLIRGEARVHCAPDCACLCHTDVDDPGPGHLPTCAWSDPDCDDMPF